MQRCAAQQACAGETGDGGGHRVDHAQGTGCGETERCVLTQASPRGRPPDTRAAGAARRHVRAPDPRHSAYCGACSDVSRPSLWRRGHGQWSAHDHTRGRCDPRWPAGALRSNFFAVSPSRSTRQPSGARGAQRSLCSADEARAATLRRDSELPRRAVSCCAAPRHPEAKRAARRALWVALPARAGAHGRPCGGGRSELYPAIAYQHALSVVSNVCVRACAVW